MLSTDPSLERQRLKVFVLSPHTPVILIWGSIVESSLALPRLCSRFALDGFNDETDFGVAVCLFCRVFSATQSQSFEMVGVVGAVNQTQVSIFLLEETLQCPLASCTCGTTGVSL